MKKSSWIILGAIVVLAGLLIFMKIASAPRLSDEEQIHQLLNDAQSAVGRKDVRGAMACVSADYMDPSGINFDRLRVLTIRGFHTSDRFVASLENTTISIEGKTATVQADVSVAVLERGNNMREVFSSPMTFEMKKEPARRWLIFPIEKWRITSITNIPSGGLDVD